VFGAIAAGDCDKLGKNEKSGGRKKTHFGGKWGPDGGFFSANQAVSLPSAAHVIGRQRANCATQPEKRRAQGWCWWIDFMASGGMTRMRRHSYTGSSKKKGAIVSSFDTAPCQKAGTVSRAGDVADPATTKGRRRRPRSRAQLTRPSRPPDKTGGDFGKLTGL
jgi:hypothetical protein